MQNSEFGIQSESEAGRWIASPAATAMTMW